VSRKLCYDRYENYVTKNGSDGFGVEVGGTTPTEMSDSFVDAKINAYDTNRIARTTL